VLTVYGINAKIPDAATPRTVQETFLLPVKQGRGFKNDFSGNIHPVYP
jgi:hypothetical protein